MKVSYQCEICYRTYKNEKDARDCESKGIETPALKVGDIINFKDCKETPIAYSKVYEKETWGYVYNEDVIDFWHECLAESSTDSKYKIKEIIKDGHRIRYVVDNMKTFSYEDYGNWKTLEYPVFYNINVLNIMSASYNNK